jgi:hypothetical protein
MPFVCLSVCKIDITRERPVVVYDKLKILIQDSLFLFHRKPFLVTECKLKDGRSFATCSITYVHATLLWELEIA